MSYALFFLHELLAGMLFYTCFCRAIRMDKSTTTTNVMLAFWGLGVASVIMLAAPIVSTWQPTIPSLALMLSIIVVQLTTSHYWTAGVPKQFQKSKETP